MDRDTKYAYTIVSILLIMATIILSTALADRHKEKTTGAASPLPPSPEMVMTQRISGVDDQPSVWDLEDRRTRTRWLIVHSRVGGVSVIPAPYEPSKPMIRPDDFEVIQ